MPCRTLDYTNLQDWPAIATWLDRRKDPDTTVDGIVRDILAAVKDRGNDALVEYTRTFDCPNFDGSMLRVPKEAIDAALADLPRADIAILEEAIRRVRDFHANQKEKSWWTTSPDGTILGQMVRPVDRVGLYVPGGQGGETPLISSLIMNAIPAQVAGVESIAVTSPPRADATLNPYILATAALLGLGEIHLAGSAWAIGALAYGTQTIAPCDVLAGPGNIFVATAKSQLIGQVGIDMVAGPSEIVILADSSATPAWLAADMLSQAEHDPLAASILVTPDTGLAEEVRRELTTQCTALPRGQIAAKSLESWGGVITVPDLTAGAELVNLLAPEHLELALADPWTMLGSIRHAGAIFMGHTSPEPVGDYFAGPNHVLPTLRTVRFSSALSVQNFCKKSSVIATSPGYVAEHGHKIARLARLEGLEAHARSVECRTK
ncbi:MAG: histidinol dehydrogenase [Pseudodesulfovibrio sp.]|uniref:Histidinol dehydrogenase n=1 Tax=Pseudodesulfovibrio aespoeensis (strain ATCC 700646 / DSM 10631 / Aspo-2) TaxID=643562 RepID=E6VU52_PSEA9|nr:MULTISPECIES: histidinol dehydrogenase [Pseudodesulfovibrio]MBU4242894.1 histidinol dehydrogenase [Pseudomonadota bacterium]ADU62245.1 histidinol dehydrogenase [Pseudodesulfovibrio aespoeensis Aspo-2]MBU4380540.1 histidinol dehydrogenase [Pseudomonadota bacterium]MBU4476065.1 histidinol dehydrogenase [Pseudomonadota bacterium]MBU4515287.1 histidinol dehydrogenase [Pseudomonadota bacterium]